MPAQDGHDVPLLLLHLGEACISLLQLDHLDAPIGVMEEETRLPESIFKLVPELGVSHGAAPDERFDTVACACLSPIHAPTGASYAGMIRITDRRSI
jgi:hypothetical protein